MKKLVELKDSNFDVSIREPKSFKWVKTDNPVDEKTFVTDDLIPLNSGGIAWLIEPPVISKHPYDWVAANNTKYKYVLTYCEDLLNRGENFLYYPFGNTMLDEDHFDLYQNDKEKIVSMMVSYKKYAPGHIFRHQCMNLISGSVDLYGSGVSKGFTYKLDACRKYMFQIVIENSRLDYYFTEKIIDCFLTGVIPIYWGTGKVNEHFDSNGIITFSSENELTDIINNLTQQEYTKRLDSVKRNFELAKQFSYCEDWIYNQYNFIF